jgi:uncharacterized protein YndB with AHSA1/START domain
MAQNQTEQKPVIKEVILDAPVSKLWKALTDKDELKHWCFDMDAFKPSVGFGFQFYGENEGHKFLHLCKVLEIEVERKMKWLWTYKDVPGNTYVTFELFPQGNQTKLRLTHEGLETLPQDKNYSKQNFVEGWNMILGELLPKYLSGK